MKVIQFSSTDNNIVLMIKNINIYIERHFDVINCGDLMDDLRGIHDKYDVIMLLVIFVWSDDFLEFMGIDLKINNILSTKHSTQYGERRLMDFIFRARDCKIYNIEFDFPCVTPKRLSRYFFYNILAENVFKGIVESIIINFTGKINNSSFFYRSGFSKSFHPRQFYIGDCDFENHFRNIKKKVKSYIQTRNITKLTPLEELALLLQCVVHGFDNKYETLKWVCEVVQYEDLFDMARYDSIKSILNIELSNLITKEEEDRIKKEMGEKFTEVVKMSPTMAAEIRKSIDYLNEKRILEIREEAEAKGMAEGIIEGVAKGKAEGKAEAEVEIFEIFSELLEEGYDKDQILKEASKRLNSK